MKELEEFVIACDHAVVLYAECWEGVLRLPFDPLSTASLFEQAQQIVRACRRQTGDHMIGWLKQQLDDGRRLVAEELAVSPDAAEWHRINAALSGAVAGLAADPNTLVSVSEPAEPVTAPVLSAAA